jgi:hypothetical protein
MTRADKQLTGQRADDKTGGEKILLKPAKPSAEQRRKYAELRRLMAQWMADDSGQQERDWKILEKSMKENPLSLREPRNG